MNNIKRETLDRETIKDDVENLGYIFVDEYIKQCKTQKKRRVIYKDSDGYIVDANFYEFLEQSKSTNTVIHKKNRYSFYNIDLFLKLNNKNFELVNYENLEYLGDKHKLTFHCFKCNEDFILNFAGVLRGVECCICNGTQVGKYNNLEYLKPILAIEWVDSKNHLKPNEVTLGSNERVLWKCSKCEHEWETSVAHRTIDETGCPSCKNKSKGEAKIVEFLLANNISFVREKRFDNCKNVFTLPFDFYLPDYNILIEYQGRQHYEITNSYFGGGGSLEKRKHNDQIKRKYALDNEYYYLEIPYWDYKYINKILNDFLNISN